jgi:hypothetical protein
MARFTFVTWDGAGSQPPALGIGQELASRAMPSITIPAPI